jgi:hypothetical protein
MEWHLMTTGAKKHEKLRDVTRWPRLLLTSKKVQHTRQILWYYQAYYFTLIQGICTHGVQRCVGMLASIMTDPRLDKADYLLGPRQLHPTG